MCETYRIMHEGKVIVGENSIVDLAHALEIKAAIDNKSLGLEVTVVNPYKPAPPREMPKVGYWLLHKDGKDTLSLQKSESPYGGYTFVQEGYDRNCRLFPRGDGLPPAVLVYAESSDKALVMAYELRHIFAEERAKKGKLEHELG